MTIQLRHETPDDIAAIEAVTIAAFANAPHTSHTEQFIVRALRDANELALSIVAEEHGQVIGHVALSPAAITDGHRHKAKGWYGLGPISVLPQKQGQGIGAGLMRDALDQLRTLGAAGCVVPGDSAILASYGGETDEVVRLLPLLRDVVSPIIALCGRPESTLARTADIFLDVSVSTEACPLGLAPTASSTATLAMGDALAMAAMQRRGFSADDFGRIHPGGSLGTRFLKVGDIMHGGDELPAVGPDVTIKDVIHEIVTAGEHFKAVTNFLWPFKLNNPTGGWKKKNNHFTEGGDYGNREEFVNKLVQSMN